MEQVTGGVLLYTTKRRLPFVVDVGDAEVVGRYSWHSDRMGYIRRSSSGRTTLLHVQILGPAPAGLQWDHINRDKSDNRRENFRLVTSSENRRNVGPQKNNTSGIRGVGWHKQTGKWRVRIHDGTTHHYLGLFATLDEALVVRRAAEMEFWGSTGSLEAMVR